jgi:hypothetical protein
VLSQRPVCGPLRAVSRGAASKPLKRRWEWLRGEPCTQAGGRGGAVHHHPRAGVCVGVWVGGGACVQDLAKLTWPRAFERAAAAAASPFSRAPQRPINRPYLDDGIFFDLLRDSRLLGAARASGFALSRRPALLFDRLSEINDTLQGLGDELGWAGFAKLAGIAEDTLTETCDGRCTRM